MSDTIVRFEENAANYEYAVLEGQTENLRYELATLRRQAIRVDRYLGPRRNALSRLLIETFFWLNDGHRIQIRKVND